MAEAKPSELPWTLFDDNGIIGVRDANGETILTFSGERKRRVANAKFVLDLIGQAATIAAVLG